jgi:acetolactate synthase-1/2/3 large subunit
MTVAESIARWLHEKGITHGFGIVGGGNVALWEAITRLGKTEIVCCHHEQAAAMAASYYYRQCGRLALCLVTTGAGSSNAITGVLASYFDSIPLLVISGNEPSRFLREPVRVKGYQGYLSHDLARPICKYVARIYNIAEDPLSKLNTAHYVATTARQGPVWIDVPKDIQTDAFKG